MKYLKSHKIFENNDDKKLKLYQLLKDMISSYDNITERYHLEGTSFGNDLAQSEDYSISPKRLVVKITSNTSGFNTKLAEALSIYILENSTSGYCSATSAITLSQ